jgi:hypothetical protein
MNNRATFFDVASKENQPNCHILGMPLMDAASGDMQLEITPATVNRVATSSAWTRTVKIRLKNTAGQTHDWFNKSVTSGASIADTSTAGVASIPSTTLTFINGEASVVVTGSAAAWVAAETNTLTVANISIMGYTVTGGTSVETIVAS